MAVLVHAVSPENVSPLSMPDRFRIDVIHFATPAGQGTAPATLGENEFWITHDDAERIFDDGVFRIVSILDNENRTEIELSEEQEVFLEWLLKNDVQHIRILDPNA